VTVFMVLSS